VIPKTDITNGFHWNNLKQHAVGSSHYNPSGGRDWKGPTMPELGMVRNPLSPYLGK